MLLNGGSVAVAEEMAAAKVGQPLAVVEAFCPGKRGSAAIASSLFGEENVWGRMPYAVYEAGWVNQTKMDQHDLAADVGRTYRYYTGTPIFKFGSGLSLTTFAVTAKAAADARDAGGDAGSISSTGCTFASSATNGGCRLAVTVKNTGTVPGDVVVTAYFSFVAVPSQKASKMIKQLFDFARVEALPPGRSATLHMVASPETLKVADVGSGGLISAAGTYSLSFEDGSSRTSPSTVPVTITGGDTVLEPFPGAS